MRGVPILCDEKACVRLYNSPKKGIWVSGPVRLLPALGIPPDAVKVYKGYFQIWGEALKKTPLWPRIQALIETRGHWAPLCAIISNASIIIVFNRSKRKSP